MWSNISNALYVVLSGFLFVAYLFVLFQIVTDLFRDTELSGGKKALWIVGLLFIPLITALIYVVARGRGMAARQRAAARRAEAATENYIKDVAGRSSVEQITQAKALLDQGTISQDEFALLKQRAIASSYAH
ncbi:MAG: SHOCT domain-containing protein [Kofleriaceae bacterium]|nr:SHOCT domain-containing protein [Kofleriaceae bacterium]